MPNSCDFFSIIPINVIGRQDICRQEIKNPVRLWRTGFLVVAGVGLEPTTFGL